MKQEALVLIVDDNPTERDELKRLLNDATIEVQTLPTAHALLERELPDRPVCIVADLHRAAYSGLQVHETLLRYAGAAEFVFLAGPSDVESVTDVMKAGAVDCVEVPINPQRLVNAVQTALERAREGLLRRAELQYVRGLLSTLTPRERQVLPYVISGWLNKQVGQELGISEKTVKVHRGRVMNKLIASSLADLIRIAMVAGIAPIPRRHSSAGVMEREEIPVLQRQH